MIKWEYLWRQTYWMEEERSGEYVQWVRYSHVWRPDLDNEEPEPFPDDRGLDALGGSGWELVAMTPSPVSLLTRTSKQGDSYSEAVTYLLMFKRPLQAT
jgi:hypothetical protein